MKKTLDLGMGLKVARVRARLSLKRLEAFFSGHPTSITLHNIENGKHRPTPEHIRLVKAFMNRGTLVGFEGYFASRSSIRALAIASLTEV